MELSKILFEYITVFLTAMTPVGELRASIPLGLGTYNMNIFETYLISVAGNLVPVVVVLWFFEPITTFLMSKSKIANRFFNWLFDRTRRKYSKKFKKYTGYALIGFVGIPLPITGGWTGSLIAYVFGISPKKAFLHILYGVLIAGIIVTIICKTVGYVKFIIVG